MLSKKFQLILEVGVSKESMTKFYCISLLGLECKTKNIIRGNTLLIGITYFCMFLVFLRNFQKNHSKSKNWENNKLKSKFNFEW